MDRTTDNQKPPETTINLQKQPETSRNNQKPPETSRNLQKQPETSRNLQKPPSPAWRHTNTRTMKQLLPDSVFPAAQIMSSTVFGYVQGRSKPCFISPEPSRPPEELHVNKPAPESPAAAHHRLSLYISCLGGVTEQEHNALWEKLRRRRWRDKVTRGGGGEEEEAELSGVDEVEKDPERETRSVEQRSADENQKDDKLETCEEEEEEDDRPPPHHHHHHHQQHQQSSQWDQSLWDCGTCQPSTCISSFYK
ncbi:unnamed protein product [Pleuronectes platessa]|uniref:Uncharacterized protein n=1 Tax=Pleuronectes platessa TaxID=8262 RepID=A0A9N7TUI0_PLEPL|nr:unnamed protein product [Pleuronectes platessa]